MRFFSVLAALVVVFALSDARHCSSCLAHHNQIKRQFPLFSREMQRGILEDVISGGAAADFVEPMPEGKIKRQEKNKKDRKGKKDEGDDFSSGSGIEEVKPESPAADIMEGMDADVAAGVMEEMKTEVAAGVIEKMKPEAAADVITGMKPEAAAGDMEAMKPEKAAGDMEAMMPGTAADIMEEMTPENAADVVEQMVARDELWQLEMAALEPAKRNNNRREFAYQRAKLAMERNVNELMERRQANNDEHSVQPRMMRRRPAGHMNVGNARRMAERRGDASQAWNRRMNMCIEKPCEVHH